MKKYLSMTGNGKSLIDGIDWKIGDKLRVTDALQINASLKDGIYDVVNIASDGTPVIHTDFDGALYFLGYDMRYIERVTDEGEYEMSDAELGEPSEASSAESPNVTLSEIYEEICDMKAMIGRLIRNGGDE